MNIKIDEAIIEKTIFCKHDFKCLSGDISCSCEIQGSVGYNMLKIKPKLDIECTYHASFGYASFCNCPTRNELYNRYGSQLK